MLANAIPALPSTPSRLLPSARILPGVSIGCAEGMLLNEKSTCKIMDAVCDCETVRSFSPETGIPDYLRILGQLGSDICGEITGQFTPAWKKRQRGSGTAGGSRGACRPMTTVNSFTSLIVQIMLESPAARYAGNAGNEPDTAEKSGSIHESL